MTQQEKLDALEHAVINQLETDFNEQEYDAMSEMLQTLMTEGGEKAQEILYNYLSDSAQEKYKEGLTSKRY